MRRTVMALGLSLVLGLAMVGSALAWPERFEGRPKQLEVGGDSAYYIWHGDDGVHLSTTGPGRERHFRAAIHTDGEFEDVDQLHLEEADSYELHDGGKKLVVHFTTHGHIDHVRWRIADGEWMLFDLAVDGHPILARNIYLGAEGVNPASPVFRVHR